MGPQLLGRLHLDEAAPLIDLREDRSAVVAAVLNDGRSLRLDTAELQAEDDTGLSKKLSISANLQVVEMVRLMT